MPVTYNIEKRVRKAKYNEKRLNASNEHEL